jgi:hypothetical protein
MGMAWFSGVQSDGVYQITHVKRSLYGADRRGRFLLDEALGIHIDFKAFSLICTYPIIEDLMRILA